MGDLGRLIDRDGKAWPADSSELQKAVGVHLSARAFIPYATIRLGFARVLASDPDLEVWYSPTALSEQARSTLFQMICDETRRHVIVHSSNDPMQTILCRDAQAALAHIWDATKDVIERKGVARRSVEVAG